MANRIVER